MTRTIRPSRRLYGIVSSFDGRSPWPSGLLPRLLVHFNHQADLYIISEDLLADWESVNTLLDDAKAFLQTWGFCRLNLRPVHPVREGDGRSLRDLYDVLSQRSRPFHEEALAHQLVSRWMVLPVLRARSEGEMQEAMALAPFLRERMMIPSFCLSRSPGLTRREASVDTSRERILLEGKGQIVDTLHSHDLFDDLLHWALSSSGGFSLEPCPSLVVDAVAGRVRRCPRRPARPLEDLWELLSGENAEGCLSCWDALPQRIRLALAWNRREDEGERVSHQLGVFALSRGDLASAEDHFRGVALRSPDAELRGESLLYLGILYLQRGHLDEAHGALMEAANLLPQSGAVRYHLGRCQFQWRDYIAAIDLFREALDLGVPREQQGDLGLYLGISHVQLEEFSEALEVLAGLDGERAPELFYEGMALVGLGRPEEALTRFRQAVDRRPDKEDLPSIWFYLGHCLKELGRWEEAIPPLRESLREDPRGYEAWNLLGYCLFRSKSFHEAIGAFLKALEINPRSAVDHANIGSNLRDLGDLEGAAQWYRRALKLDPTLGWAAGQLEKIESGRGTGNPESGIQNPE